MNGTVEPQLTWKQRWYTFTRWLRGTRCECCGVHIDPTFTIRPMLCDPCYHERAYWIFRNAGMMDMAYKVLRLKHS